MSAVPDDVSTELVLALLQDPERRRLLEVLGQLETPERLSALTRSVAMATGDQSESLEHVALRLYHTHLPKFEDAGLVTYDLEEDAVELTERGRALAAAVESSFDD